jgi:hypothetical protein
MEDSSWAVAGQFILPAAALALVLGLMLLLWRFELHDERDKVQRLTAVMGEQAALRLEHAIRDHLSPLHAIRREHLAGRIATTGDFDRALASVHKTMDGYGFLAWIAHDKTCRAVVPRKDHLSMLGRPLFGDPEFGRLLQQVRSTRSDAPSLLSDLASGAPCFYVALPLLPSDSDGGILLAKLEIASLVHQALDAQSQRDLSLQLRDPAGQIL